MKILKENSHLGFTLLELMIAMAIASIMFIGMWQFFESQQRTDAVQRQLVDMNQSVRAAIELEKVNLTNQFQAQGNPESWSFALQGITDDGFDFA